MSPAPILSAGRAAPAAIAFRDITKTFNTPKGPFQALGGVSFDVEQGEIFGLLGPNGAGKTTLISILAGLTRATSGQVSVMGHDVVADYTQSRRLLGVVPQELVFDPFFNLREALRIQSGYFGIRNNADWIDDLLHSLGLADKANSNMRQLSGGMKRRAMVAQALVHKPKVIVLDEPTAGVDVELRQTLWQFVSRLNREGSTVLLTTHYLEEAEALCGRIAMIKRGQVVALEKTSVLLSRASSSVLRFKTDGCLAASLGGAGAGDRPGGAVASPQRGGGGAGPGRRAAGRPGGRRHRNPQSRSGGCVFGRDGRIRRNACRCQCRSERFHRRAAPR
jgi:ABC-2 type transport system ATP-binding protein